MSQVVSQDMSSGQAHDVLSSISTVFIVLDANENVLQWNEAAERVLGRSAEQALGQAWEALNLPWQGEQVRWLLETSRQSSQKSWQKEILVLDAQGRQNSYAFVCSPLRRSAPSVLLGRLLVERGGIGPHQVALGLEKQLLGDIRPLGVILMEESEMAQEAVQAALAEQTRQREQFSGWVLLGIDLTERRILESQVAQHQKLEAIGQLAAGVAHEINTPTQFIGDNLRFLQDALRDLIRLLSSYKSLLDAAESRQVFEPERQTVLKLCEEIDLAYLLEEMPLALAQSLEGNERIATIVRAMKEFSHPGSDGFTSIDVNHALTSTLTVARNEYKYVADLSTSLAEHLPPLPCLPSELNQVFLNLLINAAHAIQEKAGKGGEKGQITVRTRQAGDVIEIDIADTGNGIPTDIQSRVFDPFFTTKGVGKGTGQGLAIAHAVIVEKHRGSISFVSKPGEGTTFTIRLPLAPPETEETALS